MIDAKYSLNEIVRGDLVEATGIEDVSERTPREIVEMRCLKIITKVGAVRSVHRKDPWNLEDQIPIGSQYSTHWESSRRRS